MFKLCSIWRCATTAKAVQILKITIVDEFEQLSDHSIIVGKYKLASRFLFVSIHPGCNDYHSTVMTELLMSEISFRQSKVQRPKGYN
jgi:hypothetical protein